MSLKTGNKMTIKTTINFNEIQGIHKESVKKIIEKPYDQLSQEDLLHARSMLDNHRDLKWQEDEQYQIFNRLLNITLDSQLYRPMDQRTFIEYVIDIIYDWVHENLEYGTETFDPYNVFEGYYADGTITYNTQMTLNYIRAFWDDFHDEDIEDKEAKFIFNKPEIFFVQQCYYMSVRVLEAIFGPKEEYSKQDFLDYADNYFDISALTDLIY